MASKESYRTELRSAARQLGDRCLYSAAKWYLFHKPSLHLSKPSTQTLIFFFLQGCRTPCQFGAGPLRRFVHTSSLFALLAQLTLRFYLFPLFLRSLRPPFRRLLPPPPHTSRRRRPGRFSDACRWHLVCQHTNAS